MAAAFSGFRVGYRPRMVRARAAISTAGQWYFLWGLGAGTQVRPLSWPTSGRLPRDLGAMAS